MKKIGTIALFVLCLFLLQCNQKGKQLSDFHFIIIDTVKSECDFFEKSRGVRVLSEILYIGEIKDTININHQIESSVKLPIKTPDTIKFNAQYSEYLKNRKKYEKYIMELDPIFLKFLPMDYVNLEIFIDTSQIITKNNIRAYPLIIKNTYKDTLVISPTLFPEIPNCTLQAIDSTGNWKPIADQFTTYQLPTSEYFILSPNQIVVSSIYIYNGLYKTRLRIKMGENSYSNIIEGCINYGQFYYEFD